MESYIVRVYRREEAEPKNLVGIVERVGVEGKIVFHTPEELIKIFIPGVSPEQVEIRGS